MDINAVLNNFIKQQGYNDLHATYLKYEDSYYLSGSNHDTVVLGGMSDLKADEIFMNLCKNEFGLKVEGLHIETLSFLHEIGHYITIDFLDDEEIQKSELTKMMIYMSENDYEYTDEDYIRYMTCPIEYEATLDAVKFCNTCPEVVKKLDRDIQEALYGIYD